MYDSWIYNYISNQCLSPLTFIVLQGFDHTIETKGNKWDNKKGQFRKRKIIWTLQQLANSFNKKKNHDLLKNFVISLLTVTKQPSHLYKINVKMSIENRREINPGLITNVYLVDKFIPKKGTETLKQKVVETL
jgi:hypothetical protein